MDETKAKALLEELEKHFAIVLVVQSAPAASPFSHMGGSIVYEKAPAKVPLSDFFALSPQVFGTKHGAERTDLFKHVRGTPRVHSI